MPRLSLCMIVKNEQHFLRECLLSVQDFVDEIVIVDTGSSDETKDIAREFTSLVFDFPWNDDFAAARNESLRHATGDWILILDADEILDAKAAGRLREALAAEEAWAYYLPQLHYTNTYLSHPDFIPLREGELGGEFAAEFKGYYPCFVIRLFRRDPGILFSYCVHETVYPSLKRLGKSPQHIRLPIHHLHERKGSSVLNDKQNYYFQLSLLNIQRYPSYAKSYNDVAVYYNRYRQDPVVALSYCQKAVELEPENVEYKLHLFAVTVAGPGNESLSGCVDCRLSI